MRRPSLAVVPALGLAEVVLGAVAPPPAVQPAPVALLRVVLAAAAAVALVFGPGLALRAAALGRGRRFPLAFVGLPGPAILALAGGLCWWAAPAVKPRLTATCLLVPVLVWLVLAARRPLDPGVLGEHGRRAIAVILVVLAVVAAKDTWSPGPPGELYGGTVSRTLEVGQRSDSRIGFHVVQLVASGAGPYTAQATTYFTPWSFSDRGPLAGMAAAPMVLLAGGRPPVSMPDQPWRPFDREGFAAYRVTMSTLALTCLLALFALVRRAAGDRLGLQAVLLAALTPFVVHEAYFTWPKLLATGMVLAAGTLVLDRRPAWAGLLIGAAYLVHPMALFSLPAAALLYLLVEHPTTWRRLGRALAGAAAMGAAAAVWMLAWRLVNGHEYQQSGFLQYALNADGQRAAGLGRWLSSRTASVLNTLVPLRVVVAERAHPAMNSITGPSPGVVRFFLQYWTALPFGLGLVVLPLAAGRLARSARRWPAAVTATVVVPFAVFTAYWGADRTGLLREGMHVWVLTLVAFAALGARPAGDSRLAASVWALRSVEVLAVLLVPAAVAGDGLWRGPYAVSDLACLAVMVAGLAWLARETYAGLQVPAAPVDPGSAEPVPGTVSCRASPAR